ncbi:zinc-binding alcohol dehydrogenase family protein, partial [Myxococcota bacterium]|nr:zinc-binding alcohol dehydrogenase family protein [Myxococcota bacterium]MBU1535245.1 zinc-binding alcohol dehydrogenase family protein [Myxococcota bacterium]
FQLGDRVWYAGELNRPGCNARLQLVDHRLVSRAPQNLVASAAAAMPLTSITAWELLFERLEVQVWPGQAVLLVSGGSGGVGSMVIQLARVLTDATIIATASTQKGREWCLRLGAHHVVDHRAGDLAEQVKSLGIAAVSHVVSLSHTHLNFLAFTSLLLPFGKLVLIDDPEPLDVLKLKPKSLSLHYELMFSRSLFHTDDMGEQGKILARVAAMVESGQLVSTEGTNLGALTLSSLREAHGLIEAGEKGPGKIVLEKMVP